MSVTTLCFAAVCGGMGAVCRYSLDMAIRKYWQYAFPLSTTIINVIASFTIGVLYGVHLQNPTALSASVYIYLTSGFLGGLSTFSTVSVELATAVRQRRYAVLMSYWGIMIVLPVLCVALGYWVTTL